MLTKVPGFPRYLALRFYLGNTSFWDENMAHEAQRLDIGLMGYNLVNM